MSTIAELIERLEKATGPNYAIEVDIFKLIHPEYADYVQGRGGLVHRNDGSDQRVLSDVRPPNYTASVDAAIALAVRLLDNGAVAIGVTHRNAGGKTYGMAEICGPSVDQSARGATPAIALCIAVLSATPAKQAEGENR